ncbi:hypothetical protein DFP72DRAFT_59893 [Ephemerocybe angulata]|uniref:Uncharacterized protein n=1 Tax=Ephemerocybe angulata TaxID=980116 RepID=A0A8H6LWA0_9AGAR|nr:hypothetical protein DFP72DRAFT_59893 [Tulosesus angulatus]
MCLKHAVRFKASSKPQDLRVHPDVVKVAIPNLKAFRNQRIAPVQALHEFQNSLVYPVPLRLLAFCAPGLEVANAARVFIIEIYQKNLTPASSRRAVQPPIRRSLFYGFSRGVSLNALLYMTKIQVPPNQCRPTSFQQQSYPLGLARCGQTHPDVLTSAEITSWTNRFSIAQASRVLFAGFIAAYLATRYLKVSDISIVLISASLWISFCSTRLSSCLVWCLHILGATNLCFHLIFHLVWGPGKQVKSQLSRNFP